MPCNHCHKTLPSVRSLRLPSRVHGARALLIYLPRENLSQNNFGWTFHFEIGSSPRQPQPASLRSPGIEHLGVTLGMSTRRCQCAGRRHRRARLWRSRRFLRETSLAYGVRIR